MIQPNELRIGNYVYYNGNCKEVGKITALVQEIIFDLNFCHIDNRINLKIRDIKPIPTTRESLELLGFQYTEPGIYETDSCAINIVKDLVFIKGITIDLPEYIHELQNLHFALTKTEFVMSEKL